MYSGVRAGSFIPPTQRFAESWNYLKWKNVAIRRSGRDEKGDRFVVSIEFQHVKCRDNVISNADHEFKRSFTCTKDRFTNLPSMLISLLVSRGYLEDDFEEWYMSGKPVLLVEKEALDLPVFCKNVAGGHNGLLSENVWCGQNANKAIRKAFKEVNVGIPVTAYNLQRNFIQVAQTATSEKNVAILAGYQPQSIVQYTKYGNSFGNTDIVKLIQGQTFEEVETINKFVEGIYSKARIYERLSRDDYKKFVGEKLKDEQEKLDKVKKALQTKYGTLERAYTNWTEQESSDYLKVYKPYKNKQDILRRSAMKLNGNIRKAEALRSMKVNEEEEQEVANLEQNEAGESSVSNVNPRRSLEDERHKAIIKFSKAEQAMKSKLTEKHYCKLCLEDPGLKETCKVIERRMEHVRHLFTGFMSPSWTINHSNKSGQHTNCSKLIYSCDTKCSFCGNFPDPKEISKASVSVSNFIKSLDDDDEW